MAIHDREARVDMDQGSQFLSKPIIVIGAPRSGTTFLYNVLAAHPDLVGFNEPRLVWRYGNDRKSDLLRAEDASPEVVAHIRAYFAREVAKTGVDRFVEKTPANSLRIPFVDRIFPDARYLIIYRNGVDAVLSAAHRWETGTGIHGERASHLVGQRFRELGLRRIPYYGLEFARRIAPSMVGSAFGSNPWGPRLPGMRGMMKEFDTLEMAAIQWRACVEQAHQDARDVPPERVLEIRLENLSENRLPEILEFCELDDDAAVRSAYSRYFEARPPRRHALATSEQMKMVLRRIEPTMAWLGYTDGMPGCGDE